jgi:hypothetical protein
MNIQQKLSPVKWLSDRQVRIVLAAIAMFCLVSSSFAVDSVAGCGFVSRQGERITWIDNTDYDFRYDAADGTSTLCLLLRSPEQTSGVCDNGVDDEFYYAQSQLVGPADLLVFNHEVWYQACQPASEPVASFELPPSLIGTWETNLANCVPEPKEDGRGVSFFNQSGSSGFNIYDYATEGGDCAFASATREGPGLRLSALCRVEENDRYPTDFHVDLSATGTALSMQRLPDGDMFTYHRCPQ